MSKLFSGSFIVGLCTKMFEMNTRHHSSNSCKLGVVLTALFVFTLQGFGATINVAAGESIQTAIEDAKAGDAIQLAAGVYEEQVTITKNIALIGAESGSTTIKAPAGDLAELPGRGVDRSYVVGVDGVIAVIEGITVDGNSSGVTNSNLVGIAGFEGATLTVTDSTIQNTKSGTAGGIGVANYDGENLTVTGTAVKDFGEAGIVFDRNATAASTAVLSGNTITGSTSTVQQLGISVRQAETVSVTKNVISGIAGGTINNVASSIALFRNGTVTVTENTITGSSSLHEYGITVKDSGGTVTVRGNKVDKAGFGIVFDGVDVTFSGTIIGNDVKGAPVDGAGIWLDSVTGTVKNNAITGNDTGIFLLDDKDSKIYDNEISGVGEPGGNKTDPLDPAVATGKGWFISSDITKGAKVSPAEEQLDATNNWFGITDYATINAQLRGSEIDTAGYFLTGDSDNGAVGFVPPVNLNLSVDAAATEDLAAYTFKTIQRAVDFAKAGYTINVAAGSYVEQVTIPISLTLTGAGSGTTTIESPKERLTRLQGDGQDRTYVVGVNNANVLISGFTIDGSSAGAKNAYLVGIGGFLGAQITVSNCRVQNVNGGTTGGIGIAGFDSGSLQVTGTIIETFRLAGVVVRGNGGVFTDATIGSTTEANTITGTTGSTVPQSGVSISGVTTVSIVNNTITQISGASQSVASPNINSITSPISLSNNGTSTISGNTLTGTGGLHEYGVSVYKNTVSLMVSKNMIQKFGFGVVFDGTGGTFSGTIDSNTIKDAPLDGAGIFVDTVTAIIINNLIAGNDTGIYLLNDKGSRINKNEISGVGAAGGDKTGALDAEATGKGWFISNDITEDGITFTVATVAIDAAQNWFGTVSTGTIEAQIRGAVTIREILPVGTSTAKGTGFIPTVTINRKPVIDTAIRVNVDEDKTVIIDVIKDGIASDKDFADGADTLKHEIINQPDNGTLVFVSAAGKGVYTPNVNFNGEDKFTLRTTDSKGEKAEGVIKIIVAAVNDKPTVSEVFVNVKGVTETSVPLKVTDVDDTAGFTLSVTNLPANFVAVIGTLTTNVADGKKVLVNDSEFDEGDIPLLFTPKADFNGFFTFQYSAKDGSNAQSESKDVRINVGSPAWFPAIDLETVKDEDGRGPLTVAADEQYEIKINKVSFKLDAQGNVDLTNKKKNVISSSTIVIMNIRTSATKTIVDARDYLLAKNRGLQSNKKDSKDAFKDEYRVQISKFDTDNMMNVVVVSDRLETVGSDETNADNTKLIIPPLTYAAPTVDGGIPTEFDADTATNPRFNAADKDYDFAVNLKNVSGFRVQVGEPTRDAVGIINGIGKIVLERLIRIDPYDTNNGFIRTEGRFVAEGLIVTDAGEYVVAVKPINPDIEAVAVVGLAAANVIKIDKKVEFTEKPKGIDAGGILDTSMKPGINIPDFKMTGFDLGTVGASGNAEVKFEWNAVPQTREYFIYVTEFRENKLVVDTTKTKGALSFTMDLGPGFYRWHIITQNEAGNAPFWSPPKFFFLGPQPISAKPIIKNVTVTGTGNDDGRIYFGETTAIKIDVAWIKPGAKIKVRLASSIGNLVERTEAVTAGAATTTINIAEADSDINFKLAGDPENRLSIPTYFITLTPVASDGTEGSIIQRSYVPEVKPKAAEIKKPSVITLTAAQDGVNVEGFTADSLAPTKLTFEAAIKILNPRTRFVNQDVKSVPITGTLAIDADGKVNNIKFTDDTNGIFVNPLSTSELILKIRVRGETDTKTGPWSRQFLFKI